MTTPTPEQMRELADERGVVVQHWGETKRWATDAESALRVAADQLEAVKAEVIRYAGWHEQSPEDSWRFERDIRTALGMEQYDGDDDD